MKNISDYAFKPFECGCTPYVNAFSYEGWWQYGQHVKRGVVGRKPQLFEVGPRGITEGREKLFCDCQTAAAPQLHSQRHARHTYQRATRVAPPEIVVRNHSNGPAVARIPIEAVTTSPAEVAVQPATTVDRELYEVAQRVQQNTEASLLDDMLAGPEAQQEVVTIAAHPLTQVAPEQDRKVRTITNATVLEERAIRRDTPRAPQTRTTRPNTNEIGAAPTGAMPLAEMMAQLAK